MSIDKQQRRERKRSPHREQLGCRLAADFIQKDCLAGTGMVPLFDLFKEAGLVLPLPENFEVTLPDSF